MLFVLIIIIISIYLQNTSIALETGAATFDAKKPHIIQEIVTNIPDRKTITFTTVPRGIILSIAQSELFEGNSDKISECGKILLIKIANLLKTFDNKCTIEAHTEEILDFQGLYEEDWEISIVRANAIAVYMVKVLGIDSERIFPIGFGKIMPFYENVAPAKFPDNRIDFVIFDYTVHR